MQNHATQSTKISGRAHRKREERICLPVPSLDISEKDAQAVYAKFMRHLRHVPNSRMEIKVLSAIQFTADMLGFSDAHVSKVLVDLGLRAPRMAFPAEFLRFADNALMRSGWEVGGPSQPLVDLKRHWDQIGEDKFAFVNGDCSVVREDIYIL